MISRVKLPDAFAVRGLAACVLALYAAATAGQAIPTLCLGECMEELPSVISGPLCCPMGCAVAGHDHHHPAHLPAECDFCSLLMPLCVAAMPPEMAFPVELAWGPTSIRASKGHGALWRGPASPRDPPLAV